jgi:hypothetical protein
MVAHRLGIRPTLDYQPATRPRMTKHQLLVAVNRAVGYAAIPTAALVRPGLIVLVRSFLPHLEAVFVDQGLVSGATNRALNLI